MLAYTEDGKAVVKQKNPRKSVALDVSNDPEEGHVILVRRVHSSKSCLISVTLLVSQLDTSIEVMSVLKNMPSISVTSSTSQLVTSRVETFNP